MRRLWTIADDMRRRPLTRRAGDSLHYTQDVTEASVDHLDRSAPLASIIRHTATRRVALVTR